jgi:hypothetical protein
LDVYKCDKGNIDNCLRYFDVLSLNGSGCSSCDKGYRKKETVAGSKNWTCEKLVGTKGPLIDGCSENLLVPDGDTGVKTECIACKSTFAGTYVSNASACIAFDAATKIANCDRHYRLSPSSEVSCSVCNSGYIRIDSKVCSPWGDKVGCDDLS